MSGKDLRIKTMRELIDLLEFVGSCESPNEISRMCSSLEEKLVETALAEGWEPYAPNYKKDENETT